MGIRRVPRAWSSSLDGDRAGWVVVSLRGGFSELDAGVAVSALLFDLVTRGNRVITVDARHLTDLGLVLCRGLVAVAEQLEAQGGWLVVSGLGAGHCGMVGDLDQHRAVHLVPGRA